MQKIFTYAAASIALLSLTTATSHAQQLRALGVSGSFNVARLHTGQSEFQLGSVMVDPLFDQSNDETGNGVTLFGRWQLGHGGWYAQPELGYVSTLETPLNISYQRGSFSFAPHDRLRHFDVRLLAGYQSGPLRLFAGPSVGYFLRFDPPSFPDPEVQAVMQALHTPPTRVQAALQAGVGVSLWRLDVNARYEWGLTQYSRTVRFQQESRYLNRNLQQLILEVGFRFYNRPASQ
ncbi:MAG TPA: hypothetical protein VF598_03065 [Hymenobacter sp.]|jgi:hypothetical protein